MFIICTFFIPFSLLSLWSNFYNDIFYDHSHIQVTCYFREQFIIHLYKNTLLIVDQQLTCFLVFIQCFHFQNLWGNIISLPDFIISCSSLGMREVSIFLGIHACTGQHRGRKEQHIMGTQSQCLLYFLFLLLCSYLKRQHDNKSISCCCVAIVQYWRTHSQFYSHLPSYSLHITYKISQAHLFLLIIITCWPCLWLTFAPFWKAYSTWQGLWHFSVYKNHFRNLLKYESNPNSFYLKGKA